jgi:hypothetical protein
MRVIPVHCPFGAGIALAALIRLLDLMKRDFNSAAEAFQDPDVKHAANLYLAHASTVHPRKLGFLHLSASILSKFYLFNLNHAIAATMPTAHASSVSSVQIASCRPFPMLIDPPGFLNIIL